jgi:hypothetical protein
MMNWGCTRSGAMRIILAAVGLALLLTMGRAVRAAPAGRSVEQQRVWERYWRRYAMQWLAFEDGFVVCPSFDRRYPSSLGKTTAQVQEENTRRWRETVSTNLSMTKTWTPPEEEGKAVALPLPAMAVGEYGYVHSFRVVAVRGEEEAIIDQVWLIDAAALENEMEQTTARHLKQGEEPRAVRELVERTFAKRGELADRQDDRGFAGRTLRLSGVATKTMIEGERWTPRRGIAGVSEGDGLQIAVVKEEWPPSKRRARERSSEASGEPRPRARRGGRLVALAAVRFAGPGLEEGAFVAALQARGVTPVAWVEKVQGAIRAADGDEPTARLKVLKMLMNAQPEDGPEAGHEAAAAAGKSAAEPVH